MVDLFVHSSGHFVLSSGPFGGPFFVWVGSSIQNPENPPPPPGYGLEMAEAKFKRRQV